MCEVCELKTSTKNMLTMFCSYGTSVSVDVISDLSKCRIGISNKYGYLVKEFHFAYCPICGRELEDK